MIFKKKNIIIWPQCRVDFGLIDEKAQSAEADEIALVRMNMVYQRTDRTSARTEQTILSGMWQRTRLRM